MVQNVPSTTPSSVQKLPRRQGRPAQPGGRAPRWFDRLSVAQKLGLAGLLFALPTLQNVITATQTQNRLVTPITSAGHITPFIQAANTLQSRVDDFTLTAAREGAGAAQLTRAAQAVNAEVSKLEALLASNRSPGFFSPLPGMRRELREDLDVTALRLTLNSYFELAKTADASVLAENYRAVHAALMTIVRELERVSALQVGGGQGEIYFLKEAGLDGGAMDLRYRLVYAKLLADSVQGNTDYSESDRRLLGTATALLEGRSNAISESIGGTVTDETDESSPLQAAAAELGTSVNTVLGQLEAVSLGLPAPSLDALIQQAVRRGAQFTEQSTNEIASVSARIQGEYTRRAALTLGLTLLVILAAVWLLVTLLRRFVSQLQRLSRSARELSAGNLDVQVPVTSQDELGELSEAFNAASAQLRANAERDAQERLEAQRLQHNIGEFLDVTMTIADGDLTRRGKVTEDVLGNVVDSINLMTDELAGTLKQVQHASESVTGGSRQMLGTTEQIQQGAQLTAEQAQRVAEQVEQITRAIRTMAHSAQTSAETARQALLASQQGQQAVQETLGGMQNIRTEVQGVSRRVRSLGERSLEIQEIVDTISQIARRTNLLALNASVEAAGAGEAGGRFGAVADEIRQLATTSAQATTRIASLIKSVQLEVQDVIIGAEEGTREVEQGYRIAGSAGERLREIGQLTEHSAQLAESIAASTQQQVHGVEQVSSAVQQIASVAQQAEGAVQQGRNAAEQLEALAGQLNAALRRFRLPA